MPDRSYLDWPFFDERHRLLKAELEEFAAGLGELAEDDRDVDATCRALVRRLGAAGLLALSRDLDVRSLCLAREALAYRGGLPDFAFAMQGLGSGAVTLFGSDAQRELLLPRVVAGEAITGFALSESQAGSDVAALAMSARADGDGYVLDGAKTWISNGGIADAYVVFARTGEAPGARGLSAFLVDADAPGLTIAERIEVIAPHPLATLTFGGVRVGRDRLIGAPG
ncbi:MAG TPA: acyl-CoA dehydrogenase family protein, partial [Solirubrobacteraceae bacterium]|nr:acyl-CoA dehydrogenase family protein [Solirubrobacteraceae bacterium]